MEIKTSDFKFHIMGISKSEFVNLWLFLHAKYDDEKLDEGVENFIKAMDDWAEFYGLNLEEEKKKKLVSEIPF